MNVVPLPAAQEFLPGVWRPPPRLGWTAAAGEQPGGGLIAAAAGLFADGAPQTLSPRPVPGPEAVLEFHHASAAADASQWGPSGDWGPEGYQLEIEPTGARITAVGRSGWWNGLQTLLQLLHGAANGRAANGRAADGIPCQRIRDAPRYAWRGMHLDVGRHFFDVPFLKRFLDLLAVHKCNVFHWHLTEDQGWRLEIPAYPRLTEVAAWRQQAGETYGGWYTEDDVREVVAYATDRCIRVVPEIELPGHCLATLAAYPELSCRGGPFQVTSEWGIFDDVYYAGQEAVFRFLEEVFDTVLRLFPSQFIHVGGDECPKTRWNACPRCQQRMRAEGLANEEELQSWFVGHFAQYLAARGRRLVGWDEILEGGLPAGATVMSWRGIEGGVAAARAGHDVVMTPTSHCYFDYRQTAAEGEWGAPNHDPVTLRQVYDYEPTPAELTSEQAAHVLGTQGNVWTERMPTSQHVEQMILPRMAALAEVAWSPASLRRWEDFRQRIDGHCGLLRGLGYQHHTLDA